MQIVNRKRAAGRVLFRLSALLDIPTDYLVAIVNVNNFSHIRIGHCVEA